MPRELKIHSREMVTASTDRCLTLLSRAFRHLFTWRQPGWTISLQMQHSISFFSKSCVSSFWSTSPQREHVTEWGSLGYKRTKIRRPDSEFLNFMFPSNEDGDLVHLGCTGQGTKKRPAEALLFGACLWPHKSFLINEGTENSELFFKCWGCFNIRWAQPKY